MEGSEKGGNSKAVRVRQSYRWQCLGKLTTVGPTFFCGPHFRTGYRAFSRRPAYHFTAHRHKEKYEFKWKTLNKERFIIQTLLY